MRIFVGSQNKVKLDAVREVMKSYVFFKKCEIKGININSGVSDQPKTLDETLKGAVNRAIRAHRFGCSNRIKKYGIGIESGLMEVPSTITGYMEFTSCVIYDGKNKYFGLSPAFECPEDITKEMINNNLDLNQACYKLGYSNNTNLGCSEGIIGILTKNRITRKDYTKQAVIMAMVNLEK